VGWVIEERERLATELRALDLDPLPSHANLVFIPVNDPHRLAERLLVFGWVPRVLAGGIRVRVRDRKDDDLLLRALTHALEAE
jgi:histidinol-phosphate/aromatic aminotransferase/cobyric acid decarboxylase-like protein